MPEQNPQIDALLELERRHMTGDSSITPDQWSKVSGRLKAFRDQGLVKPIGGTRVLSSKDRGDIESDVGSYSSLKNSLGTFNPDYAGNTFTGEAENYLQSKFGTGTTGQRDWWANFRSTDNVIRNTLFGSALTVNEKAAYEATTIWPSMKPDIIKENLARRAEIIRGALSRRIDYFKKAGYDSEAVDALTGSYGADLSPDAKPLWTPKKVDDTPAAAAAALSNEALVMADEAPRDIGPRLSPEDETALVKFAPTATSPEALQGWFAAKGMTITPENAKQVFDYYQKGGTEAAGIDYTKAEQQRKDKARAELKANGTDGTGAAVLSGAGDTASLGFVDEGAALAKTVFKGGTFDENLGDVRARQDVLAEDHPIATFGGQLVGGALIPYGGAAKTIWQLAKTGATLGALYGVGSGRDWRERGIGGVTGGFGGAALGATFGKLGDLYRGRFGGGPGGGARPATPDDLGTVANRMGITPSPATVGGRSAEALQIGLGNAPGSMGPVRAGVDREIDALSASARSTADRMGTVSTPQQAGEVLSRGAKVADRAQARAAGRAYDARTDMMGGAKSPVVMGGTQTAIRNVAGDFSTNEVIGDMLKHPLVKKLEAADAPELTLGESTELLSETRRVLRRARETKQPGRLVNQLSDLEKAIEGDVMRAAQASDAIAGRASDQGAEAMQRQGDSLWADRMQAQKREFKRMLASSGDDVNTSGESVYRQLFGDMREEGGNLVRLRKTLDRLPKRARDTFSATAFDDLGKARPGAQNAEGDAWSFETFMTNWGKMSDDAKRLVFMGRGVDREVSDIVRYAARLRTLNKARNFSNTGATAANASYVTALVGSLFTGGPMATAAVGATYPAMNIAGRAFMATPALRSWLRSAMQGAVRGNESQVRTLVRRLPSLAAKNPALSAEISQLERALLSAVNDNRPISAAASDGDKQEGGKR